MHPNLKEFRSDLEIAPVKTLLLVSIPDSVSTCFLHFSQAHWRKIQSLGLMELYTSNEDYSLLLRCFTALAFVPEVRIIEYFNLLCESLPEDAPTRITEFTDYVVETYIGQEMYERIDDGANDGLVLRIREPTWKRPKFSPKLWSVHDRVLNNEPRTTNTLEGWYRRFRSIVVKHHPNIEFLRLPEIRAIKN